MSETVYTQESLAKKGVKTLVNIYFQEIGEAPTTGDKDELIAQILEAQADKAALDEHFAAEEAQIPSREPEAESVLEESVNTLDDDGFEDLPVGEGVNDLRVAVLQTLQAGHDVTPAQMAEARTPKAKREPKTTKAGTGRAGTIFTDDEIREIRTMWASGTKVPALLAHFTVDGTPEGTPRCSYAMMRNICLGNVYKHVK